MRRNQKFIFLFLGILFFLNVLAWLVVFDLANLPFLEVIFFEVTEGESILIKTPWRHQILIDGGGNSLILEKLAKEIPFWDRTIDLIILTHPEFDHLRGLLEVLKRYKVENILWTGIVKKTTDYSEWKRLIEEENGKIFIGKIGQKIILPKTIFEVVHPLESLEGKEFKDSNDTSLVLKLVFGQVSFLFTGDIYKSAERELIKKGVNLDAEILKVAHHGSKTSTSEEFLRMVSPCLAIISSPKNNPYNHPHQEVLETLHKYGIKVLRTDLNGDLKIISDGSSFKIKSQNGK